MLSYRHSFHAGNYADVLKHIVQVEIIEHLLKKDAPFDYVDSHSGAGLFNLQSDHAQKLEEHTTGVLKIKPADFPELAAYFDVVKSYNHTDELLVYPGSPAITKKLMRPYDRAWLYELHPEDYGLLAKNMGSQKNIRVSQEDGLTGMMAVLPPVSRRALVLVDPSYEIKSDYDDVVKAVEKAYKKFTTGTYAIWYPVVDRPTINRLEKKFIASGIKNIQRFELGIAPDSKGRGMTSSGMIVINPPWTLFNKMTTLLPKIAAAISDQQSATYQCDILVGE